MKQKGQFIADIFQNKSFNKNTPSVFIGMYLFRNWKSIVGESLARISKPAGYHNQCLWVQLKSSCYVQEMEFKKQDLIYQINQSFNNTKNKNFVCNIRWTF